MKLQVILIFCIVSNIFSQTVLIQGLPHTKKTAETYAWIDDGPHTYTKFDTDHDIGHISHTTTTWSDWYSVYKVSLQSLPNGHTISKVILKAEITAKEIEDPDHFFQLSLCDNSLNLNSAEAITNPSRSLLVAKLYTEKANIDIKNSITAQHIQDGYFIIHAEGYGHGNTAASIAISIDLEYYTPVNIILNNNFVDPTEETRGSMIIDGQVETILSGGYPLLTHVGKTHQVRAVPQIDNQNIQRIWSLGPNLKSEWTLDDVFKSDLIDYTINVAPSASTLYYTANLRKEYNARFRSAQGGQIYVNGISYSGTSPYIAVAEENKLSCYALEFEQDNVLFVTDYWDYGTYNPSTNTVEWYPTSDYVTNNVHYKGKPIPYDRNLHFKSYDPNYPNSLVQLYWNQYPNSNVGYQIWRKVYQNNILLSTTLLVTLSNSATTTVDPDYIIRLVGEGDVNLSYDVRPVYLPSGIAQDENFIGWLHADNSNISKPVVNNNIEVKDYFISNYPNPFNPTTTIEYQLPKAGKVTLKVYNALGKEVANLVNDFKTEGMHTVEFVGSSLASGIYYCEFRVNDFTSIKKMLMIK